MKSWAAAPSAQIKRNTLLVAENADVKYYPYKRLSNYLHPVVEEFSRLFKRAVFLLFSLQPSLRLFNNCWVNVDKRLCFDKGPQHKSSQPVDELNKGRDPYRRCACVTSHHDTLFTTSHHLISTALQDGCLCFFVCVRVSNVLTRCSRLLFQRCCKHRHCACSSAASGCLHNNDKIQIKIMIIGNKVLNTTLLCATSCKPPH